MSRTTQTIDHLIVPYETAIKPSSAKIILLVMSGISMAGRRSDWEPFSLDNVAMCASISALNFWSLLVDSRPWDCVVQASQYIIKAYQPSTVNDIACTNLLMALHYILWVLEAADFA